jgi:hypothetical protein
MTDITTRTVEFTLDGKPVKLTIERATALNGMRRSILQYKGIEQMKDIDDEALRTLRLISYSDLVAAVTVWEGISEMTFEQFIGIPDTVMQEWESAVYTVNPHWNPMGQPPEEKQKKVRKSTGG